MKKLYSILLVLLAASVSAQTVYYVNSATGNNANDGLSETITSDSGPKATIGGSLGALASAIDGDIISVAAGAYAENLVIDKSISLLKTGSGSVTITSVTFSLGGELLNPLPSDNAFASELVTVNAGSKINDAILMVSSNGTVVVNDGSYDESVFLTKSFNLIGLNAPEVRDLILSGTGARVVLEGAFNLDGSLQFNRPEGGKLELSGGFITMLQGATMTAGNNSSYAITSGSGKLLSTLNANGTIFPIGTEDMYAPATISGVDSGSDFVAASVRPAGNPLSFNPDLPLQVNSHVLLEWTLVSSITETADIRFDYTGSAEPQNWNSVQNRIVGVATDEDYVPGNNSSIGESFATASFSGISGRFAVYSDFPNAINNSTTDIIAQVYPNPFRSQFQVALEGNLSSTTTIDVLDITGRVVNSSVVNAGNDSNIIQVNLNGVNQAGLYLVRIQNNLGSKLVKVIKQ